MTVLEDVLQELREEREALSKNLKQMPLDDKSRVLGWYEGKIDAYDKMIIFVDSYSARNHKVEEEKRRK